MLQETQQLLEDINNSAKLKQIKYLQRKQRAKKYFGYFKKLILIATIGTILLMPGLVGDTIANWITEFVTPIYNSINNLL